MLGNEYQKNHPLRTDVYNTTNLIRHTHLNNFMRRFTLI